MSWLTWKTAPPGLSEEGRDLLLGHLRKATVEGFADPTVPAVSPRASLRELLFRMVSEKRSAFLVWQDVPLGTVSHIDVLLAFAAGRNAKLTGVEQVMQGGAVHAIPPDAPLLPTLAWMVTESVPLVVLTDGEEVRGVLTVSGAFARLDQLAREGKEFVQA